MNPYLKEGRKPLAVAVVSSLVTVGAPSVLAASAVLNTELLPSSSANPNAQPAPIMLAACGACYPCSPCASACSPCNPCAAACNPCNPCNPCAAACNPCNPCAAACNPCNPCAAACNPCNPCASACNPCNPCGGAKIAADDFMRPAGVDVEFDASFVAEGKRLWNDTSLSSNGLACNTCHQNNGAFNKSFTKAYPHEVAMATQRAGVGAITADEMVQFCMLIPMQADALPWSSGSLKALTAYTVALQQEYAANPCAAACSPCNPCNPCAAACNPCNPCNPCAAANPCNPCNPCAACNPCNPCNPCAVTG